MNEDTNHSSGGIGLMGLLAIVFITLKLTGHITWSWWWVLSPIWIPPLCLLFVVFMVFLWAMAELWMERRK